MYNLTAYAVRENGMIQVTLSGELANSCWSAVIRDQYPGGNIQHVMDPGTAQVFIEETKGAGSDICLMMLMPWAAHAAIPSVVHQQLTVYINGSAVLTVPVGERLPSQFIVIALSASAGRNPTGCSVIPANAMYPAIYSSVFGPASKAECENWARLNCASP